MTIREYVLATLGKFGISQTEADLLLAEKSIDPTEEFQESNKIAVKTAMYHYVPILIAGLADVSEGGYSIKHNIAGIKAWYKILASELGLEDVLSPAPVIRDRSYLW